MVSLHGTEDVDIEDMDMDHSSVDPQGTQNPSDASLDSDFGSWMLVSHRYSCAQS